MILERLIRGEAGSIKQPATVTPATVATPSPEPTEAVAGVAGVTVATGRSQTAKGAVIRADPAVHSPHETERLAPETASPEVLRRVVARPDDRGGHTITVEHTTPGPVPTEPLSRVDEECIRVWARAVGEEDEDAVAELLDECRRDATARANVLAMAALDSLRDR